MGKIYRPIDHLVFPVTTLSLGRSRLTDLGFTVAPDARHPFGTGNCCVFFANGTYLEPITILDRMAADIAASEGHAFVKRLKRFTERHGEGFAMVALKSADADADAAAFDRARIGEGAVHRFSRMAQLPDGSAREVGFASVFAETPSAAYATVFAIQHLAPDALFHPEYLKHANGALGISAVKAVAEKPAEFEALLSNLVETVEGETTSNPLQILTPAEFREGYGVDAPEPRQGLRFAAFEIEVEDIDMARTYAGSASGDGADRIVVPPSPGLGAVMELRSRVHG